MEYRRRIKSNCHGGFDDQAPSSEFGPMIPRSLAHPIGQPIRSWIGAIRAWVAAGMPAEKNIVAYFRKAWAEGLFGIESKIPTRDRQFPVAGDFSSPCKRSRTWIIISKGAPPEDMWRDTALTLSGELDCCR